MQQSQQSNQHYNFHQLSKTAQFHAVREYLAGWLEEHEDDDITAEEAWSLCSDPCMKYDQQGNYLEQF